MKSRIVLLGPPASGKGTQAELIAARHGLPITSPGAMLREEKRAGTPLGVEADKLTSQGKLMPDDLIVGLVSHWLKQHDGGFIFDGFPRSLVQARALEELLAARGTPLDAVILLEADLETLQTRVAGRLVCGKCGQIVSVGLQVSQSTDCCPRCGGELGRRTDDTPEVLAARLVEYTEKTLPLIEFYLARGILQPVDSTNHPDVVFAAVQAILEAP